MSRIGKNPVVIPAGVTVEVANGIITVKGKNGQLTQEFSTKASNSCCALAFTVAGKRPSKTF